MLLAVDVILIKKPTGSVVMLFWPIQHILEALQVYQSFCEDRHRARFTPIWPLFTIFLRNLEDNDVT